MFSEFIPFNQCFRPITWDLWSKCLYKNHLSATNHQISSYKTTNSRYITILSLWLRSQHSAFRMAGACYLQVELKLNIFFLQKSAALNYYTIITIINSTIHFTIAQILCQAGLWYSIRPLTKFIFIMDGFVTKPYLIACSIK